MLMRWDPFRELDRLMQWDWPTRAPAMPMDAHRDGDRFVVRFDLPGIDPDSIDLTVEKDVLTVAAERRETPGEGVEVLVSERPHGTFRRQLFLGDALDADHIEASYEDGVLTVTIPVAEAAKARKVAITRAGAPKAIETTAEEATDVPAAEEARAA